MLQYLSDIKHRVDAIHAAGSNIEDEDIVLYTLNGLPASYNAFKIAIRTKKLTIHLDELYSLLCSEEVNIAADQSIDQLITNPNDSAFALTAFRGRGRGRSRGRFNNARGGRALSNPTPHSGGRRSASHIECQICLKPGYSAANCWHRGNFSYQANQPQVYIAHDEQPTVDWFLDSGASSHLTTDVSHLQSPHPYADFDWAANVQDCRSISGFCTFLGDNLLSWSVKKQPTVAHSSTEAEYRALATLASDILWLRQLLADFMILTPQPTPIFCDNVSTIALANNPVFHARTKHIEVDYHFIRDCIKGQHVTVHHIASHDQIADIFTKSLSASRYQLLRSKLTILEPSSP
ncbi:Retrovirus-related Pol polyprotein from transposon TNT 1-94 [Dendrobium catenatum]|uniref:Retrovirus-related Pol polyprotein from transposon TNT 1-94 n=1 Tax=Dendrobium catenatum TaxID=906689 RepID=A0A2I0VWS3_9ASPA|nr:Retrovirus-related Pol polyprotein from transposon TNT 1-94 [Dendrobium catenatum]